MDVHEIQNNEKWRKDGDHWDSWAGLVVCVFFRCTDPNGFD